jgi:hypothetical protein
MITRRRHGLSPSASSLEIPLSRITQLVPGGSILINLRGEIIGETL